MESARWLFIVRSLSLTRPPSSTTTIRPNESMIIDFTTRSKNQIIYLQLDALFVKGKPATCTFSPILRDKLDDLDPNPLPAFGAYHQYDPSNNKNNKEYGPSHRREPKNMAAFASHKSN